MRSDDEIRADVDTCNSGTPAEAEDAVWRLFHDVEALRDRAVAAEALVEAERVSGSELDYMLGETMRERDELRAAVAKVQTLCVDPTIEALWPSEVIVALAGAAPEPAREVMWTMLTTCPDCGESGQCEVTAGDASKDDMVDCRCAECGSEFACDVDRPGAAPEGDLSGEVFENSAKHGRLFVGYEPRECGEHRTVGDHRAWCFDCSEWCYPGGEDACSGCAVSLLTAQRDQARAIAVALEQQLADAPPRAAVLRDAAYELDEMGHRAAAQYVLRLAQKAETR
jgi:hypothetical protein